METQAAKRPRVRPSGPIFDGKADLLALEHELGTLFLRRAKIAEWLLRHERIFWGRKPVEYGDPAYSLTHILRSRWTPIEFAKKPEDINPSRIRNRDGKREYFTGGTVMIPTEEIE